MPLAIAAALLSAALSAFAVAILHRSAGMVHEKAARAGLVHFLVGNAKHPLWLFGVATSTVSAVLHAVALHEGPLTAVQPLMVTGLVFALAFRQLIEGRRLSRSHLMWAGALSVGLVLFLFVAAPGQGPPQPPDGWAALIGGLVITAGISLCVVTGVRTGGKTSAAFLGGGAGLAFAGTAGLLKEVTNQLGHGVGAVVGSWPLYALAVAGLAGLVLNQLAFRAGPLTASLPALSTTDPLVSLLLGVAVFDEPFRTASPALAAELVALTLVMLSVVALSVRDPARPVQPASSSRLRASVPS